MSVESSNREVQHEAPHGNEGRQTDSTQFQVGNSEMRSIRGLGNSGDNQVNGAFGKLELGNIQGNDTKFSASSILGDRQPGSSQAMKPYQVADASGKVAKSDAPISAKEMNEQLGIKDPNNSIGRTAEYIQENLQGSLSNSQSSMRAQAAFASAADTFRHDNPNADSSAFSTAMNNAFHANTYKDNTLPTASVSADTDGNLKLSRFEPKVESRRGMADSGVPVAEANIGDPAQGTQRADNLAQTFTPDHQGKLAADAVYAASREPEFGVPMERLGNTYTNSNRPVGVFNNAIDAINDHTKGSEQPFFDAFNKESQLNGGRFSAQERNYGSPNGVRAELSNGSPDNAENRIANPPLKHP
jgi:hypothetical protein